MQSFLEFVKAWSKLIGDVFAAHQLAAALITLLAAGLFLALENKRPIPKLVDWQRITLHFFLTFIAWLIAVPLLGLVFDVAAELKSLLASFFGLILDFLSVLKSFVVFLYGVYVTHPFLVLFLAAVASCSFVIWHLMRPRSPRFAVKIGICIAAFLALTIVISPVLDAFSPARPQKDAQKTD